MKQINILSGKGGTGKTTLTASLAVLANKPVLADCDVDASNLHLLLQPVVRETQAFKGLNMAVIDPEKCIQFGRCMEVCRFNAIKDYKVDSVHCEGCKTCVISCPVKAISFEERICGHAYISDTKYGPMSHARLTPGMENSGKLVTLVRKNATKLAEDAGRELVLVDGPPGIGCPVIASLSNIVASIVVVEPTLSGIHDLKRVIELLNKFDIKPLVCVNKYDLNQENTDVIENYCTTEHIPFIGTIPFDPKVTESMVNATPIVDYAPESPASKAITKIWTRFKRLLVSF